MTFLKQMRLLPSPSISSSCSASFDENMCTSKSATANCLTGILRRIFCTRGLPTCPSDQTMETSSCVTDKHQELIISDEKPEEASVTNTPGLVARLMGLESLPDAGSEVNSILRRSRSLNSVEFRGESDQMQRQHTRVKSTMSFREMPTFLELENENFLVLRFEKVGGEGKGSRRCKERKCQVGVGELKEKRREKCKGKEDRERAVQSEKEEEKEKINKMVLDASDRSGSCDRITDGNRGKHEGLPNVNGPCSEDTCEKPSIDSQNAKKTNWQVGDGRVQARKRKKQKKMNYYEHESKEPECSSQDSSPVSVLDFGQFIIDPEPRIRTSDEAAKSKEYNSRRNLSTELDNHDDSLQRDDDYSTTDDCKSKKTEDSYCISGKKSCNSEEYLDIWDEICRVAETQVLESNWIHNRSMETEDLQGICTDFGMNILEGLLEELVDQICLKNF